MVRHEAAGASCAGCGQNCEDDEQRRWDLSARSAHYRCSRRTAPVKSERTLSLVWPGASCNTRAGLTTSSAKAATSRSTSLTTGPATSAEQKGTSFQDTVFQLLCGRQLRGCPAATPARGSRRRAGRPAPVGTSPYRSPSQQGSPPCVLQPPSNRRQAAGMRIDPIARRAVPKASLLAGFAYMSVHAFAVLSHCL
jgi:hypothetical protein